MASNNDVEKLIQQPQMNNTVPRYSSSKNKVLPARLLKASFGHAITLTVIGAISMIVGVIIYPLHSYSVVTYYGFNIWMGALYTTAGSLGIASYRYPLHIPLFTAYFAFAIIATLTAAGHVVISTMSLFYPSAGGWSLICSCVLSGLAFLVTLSCTIILSIGMCCSNGDANWPNTSITRYPYPVPAQGLPPTYANTTGNIIYTPYVVEARSPYVTSQVMPVSAIVNPQQQ